MGYFYVYKGNPWGKKEWRGDWSNHWPGWPEAIKSQLVPEGQDLARSNQGCFWMSFKDVVKYFYVNLTTLAV